jgi:hypothetical protein
MMMKLRGLVARSRLAGCGDGGVATGGITEGRQVLGCRRWAGLCGGSLQSNSGQLTSSWMSASDIISEIQRLSPADQAEVIRFAYRLDAARMLTGKEIGELAQRMIDSVDPAEKLRLREEMTRGFYGESTNA